MRRLLPPVPHDAAPRGSAVAAGGALPPPFIPPVKNPHLSCTSLFGWPGVCALLVLLLDQLTKYVVCSVWPVPGAGELVVIPGFFRLVHWRNTGAAWGILEGRSWLLGLFSFVVAAALALLWRRIVEKNSLYAIPCGVLLGGVLGNMIDRLFFPDGVVDFLRFEFWPAFNVADSAICLSVCFLAGYEFYRGWRDRGKTPRGES